MFLYPTLKAKREADGSVSPTLTSGVFDEDTASFPSFREGVTKAEVTNSDDGSSLLVNKGVNELYELSMAGEIWGGDGMSSCFFLKRV
jgi:hypothetical protein